MQQFASIHASAQAAEGFASIARQEAASRRAAADDLARAGADRARLLAQWAVPDPEEEALLAAAAALARRRVGAPIAAAALAGSQAGVLLVEGRSAPLALPLDDPAMHLLAEAGRDPLVFLRDAARAPALEGSALLEPGVDARALLAAPIRLPGGPVFGLLIAAGRCAVEPTDSQRREMIRLGERTAEEALSRWSSRTDPETGALSFVGLGAAVEREARRRKVHGRPASVAILALPTAPGAPRADAAWEGLEVTEERRAEDIPMCDSARLTPQALRAAVEETRCAVRESDMVACAPTPTEGLNIDAALDMPGAPQSVGPTCIAILMPETDAAQAECAIGRIAAHLAGVDLPGAPGAHLSAWAGIAEIGAAQQEGRRAAADAIARAYDALSEAREERLLYAVRIRED